MAELTVTIDKLKPGMVLSDAVNAPTGRKLFESGVALTEEHIETIKKSGVERVMVLVYDQYSKALASDTGTAANVSTASRFIEEDGAKKLKIDSASSVRSHAIAIERTKKFFDDLKQGATIESTAIIGAVNTLVGDVLSNPHAFSNLSILKMKDEYTYVHSVDVAVLAVLMGTNMKMQKADLFTLAAAGLLHDIGKMLVPDAILTKPGKYTDAEMTQMKKHSFLGYKLLKRENIDDRVANCVLEHHEWVNGKGYPFGKTGIYLDDFSKIIAVCDVFNALTTQRSYRDPMEPYKAVKVIAMEAGSHLDTELAKVFQRVIGMYPNGTIVLASDGSRCRVVEQNTTLPLRPVLEVIQDASGTKPSVPAVMDLAERKDIFIKEIVPTRPA
ncbi:MAG: HD-GYP domain-containing protein [Spirochaetota bacterium]